MSNTKVEVDFILKKLHPQQQFIINNAKRFNHLRCGRRFGKTTLIEELSLPALEGYPVGIWFPTYKDLSEVWKSVIQTYKPVTSKVSEQLKQITLHTQGIIDFWSMEEPDSGQGRMYKRAIIDEAAKAAKLYGAWENTIRPTLTDLRGDAFIMSRPKGKNNGFFQMEDKHKQFSNWAFFHFTSYDNPFMATAEIDEAQDQLDPLNFEQEYLAEYVDANDMPYLYAFEPPKHVTREAYMPNERMPLWFSFDFNVDPNSCLVGQQPNYKSGVIFDEISVKGSTELTCDNLIAKYSHWINRGMVFVTGDATGRSRNSISGELTNYKIIKSKLKLIDSQMKVRAFNMQLESSRVLCNSVLAKGNVLIINSCKQTISDCLLASVDASGNLNKDSGMHKLDCVRYLWEAWFPDFLDRPDKYVTTTPIAMKSQNEKAPTERISINKLVNPFGQFK